MRQESGADIAEIAAGYANDGRMIFIRPCAVSKEVIELLGEPACDVDGIGRSEEQGVVEVVVRKRCLYHPLAVVEGPADLQCGDVPAQCRELQLLYAADLSGWVEDDDVHAFHIIKAAGDGASGISGSGYEDCYGLAAVFYEVSETTAHEAGPDILKGEGGAME